MRPQLEQIYTATNRENKSKRIHPFMDKKKYPGRTEQSHKDECDINFIVKRFEKTGVITHRNNNQGSYGIATGIEFQESMDLVVEAQNMFDELPAALRRRFGHDPALFLDYVQDEKNTDEMVKLGLARAKKLPEQKIQKETKEQIQKRELEKEA